jgi:hypothetical protein
MISFRLGKAAENENLMPIHLFIAVASFPSCLSLSLSLSLAKKKKPKKKPQKIVQNAK